MKTRTSKIAILAMTVAFLTVFGVMAISFSTAQADIPGPLAAPTPVSVNPGSGIGQYALLWSAKAITQDTATAAMTVLNYGKADLQYLVDQTAVAGAPNTTTVKLQFSNDGVNWIDGLGLATANVADGGDMNQFAVFGRFLRLYADVTNSNPVTWTLSAAAK